MIIIYINCKLFPFVDLIIALQKVFETRNRNTLKKFIGKTVYIAETGKHKKPLIRCSCIIGKPLAITDIATYEQYRNQTKVEKFSDFDFIPGKKKYLYPLHNVQKIDPFTVPENIIRHGYVWCEVI